MKDREQIKNENKKNFNKKSFKSQGQFAKNQIVQTIEENQYNESGIKAKNKHDFK
ncbi:hypothetical protein [Clostridium ganghwense]|uniref:Gamma-type small acid-soluble spore protein n=1 Tax=Clostridium ganghwense TaxID=312089 RepID=A0ABT4CT26_9CLOT|nr:hypothetical protein [Clostridium ganghwense]MCY6371351.1 hypothetical protein [Clostridium ganghwense]